MNHMDSTSHGRQMASKHGGLSTLVVCGSKMEGKGVTSSGTARLTGFPPIQETSHGCEASECPVADAAAARCGPFEPAARVFPVPERWPMGLLSTSMWLFFKDKREERFSTHCIFARVDSNIQLMNSLTFSIQHSQGEPSTPRLMTW